MPASANVPSTHSTRLCSRNASELASCVLLQTQLGRHITGPGDQMPLGDWSGHEVFAAAGSVLGAAPSCDLDRFED